MAINHDVVRWRYMRAGDMLEYRNTAGNVLQIGPITEIEWKQDKDKHQAPSKKYVLVAGKTSPISVPLHRVQAIFRGGQEIIRFTDGEQQTTGCARCGQRRIDGNVAGRVFCSLACQQEWIETYYTEYAPGENPIDKGAYIHTTNCDKCRKANRIYCPKCVD